MDQPNYGGFIFLLWSRTAIEGTLRRFTAATLSLGLINLWQQIYSDVLKIFGQFHLGS